jgi:transposase
MTSLRFVGLDVHQETISVAVAEEGQAAARFVATIPNEPKAVRQLLRRLGSAKQLRCGYEAGPCGFAPYRHLTELGISCQVVAPVGLPGKAGDRVKTDRRDALKLALGLRAGALTPIWVPSPDDEALRDLVRAREDAHQDLLRQRHRLSKLLLRQGIRAPMKAWSHKHRAWLATLAWPHRAQQVTFDDYQLALDQATDRTARLDRQLLEVAGESRFAAIVAALQALYGVGFVTAITVATEVQDFRRFRPRPLMGYSGVCPSEHSSGGSHRRGPITRAGNAHLRRVLVEAAWHYRFRRKDSPRRRREEAQLPEWLRAIARRAEERLSGRFARLTARELPPQKTVLAVARELLGFLWAIGYEVEQRQLLAA